jgi:hypothetical protein
VAQVLDTYIIAVAADGNLILVDQHAAHERLTHEAIRTRMLDGGAPSQPLLLPAVVDLPEADANRLLARAEELARLGLEIESFGPGAILVRALPTALGAPEAAPLIRDIADARRGDRTDGLPRQHPGGPSSRPGRNGRFVAPNGGNASSRDLQPRTAHIFAVVEGRDRDNVWPAMIAAGSRKARANRRFSILIRS